MKYRLTIFFFVLFLFGCDSQKADSVKKSKESALEFVARAEFDSMREKMVYPPFTTEVIDMVPEGAIVEPGQQLAELSPGDRTETLLEDSANLEKLSLEMSLQEIKKNIAREIEEMKIAQIKLEMDKAKLEFDRAIGMREWLELTELEETFKLDKIKLALLKKQVNAAQKMIGRGFVAKEELLKNENELAVATINASLSVSLFDYLHENPDEKQVAQAKRNFENTRLEYELASFTQVKNLSELDYNFTQIKSNFNEKAAEVEKLKNEIASLTVIAEESGLVLYGNSYDGSALVKVRPGSMVYPGVNFLRLVDPTRGGISFLVDPKDMGMVQSAQSLYFRPDSLPEYLFPCNLHKTGALAFDIPGGRPDGRTFVDLKAEIASYPDLLKLGYSGTVFLKDAKEFMFPRFKGNRVFTVKRENVSRKSSVTGDVKPASFSYIIGAFEGKVNSLVDEGKQVEPGDVIAVIDSEDLDEKVRDMEIELGKKREELLLMQEKHQVDEIRLVRELEVKEGALKVSKLRHAALLKRREEDKIIDLQKSLEVIQARIDLAKEKVAHTQELFKKGLRSELQVLQAQQELAGAIKDREITSYKLRLEESGPTKRSVKISEIEVKKVELEKKIAEKEVSRANLVNSLTKKVLEQEISKIEISLKRRRREVEQAEIKAPAEGVAIYNETHTSSGQAKVKVGDTINPRIPFLQIADTENLQIHAEISEMDAKFVKLDDEVKIYMKGDSLTVLQGWVSSIALIANTDFKKGQEANVKVIIDLLSPKRGVLKAPKGIRPGMSCEVEFELYNKTDVLCVPYDSIIPTVNGPFVVDKDRNWKPVQVAFSDGFEGYVIESGLNEGDQILLMEADFD
jgi:multidrug efflux pump subunit AcrA (membrane-fusion protein)